MSVTPTVFQTGFQLPGSSPSPLMMPAAGAGQLLNVTFANNGAGANTVVVHLVRQGSQPGPANILIPGQVLAPSTSYVAPECWGRTLAAGDALWGWATNAGQVNMFADGFLSG